MVNMILIAVSVLVLIIVLFILYRRASLRIVEVVTDEFNTMEQVLEGVKSEIIDVIKEDNIFISSDAAFNAIYKRKARIKDALKNCVHGIDSAKLLVIQLIRDYLAESVPMEKINDLMGLSDGMQPSNHIMFEILMYKYKQTHGKKALGHLIEKYHLDRERPTETGTKVTDVSYFITVDDLASIYEQEAFYLTDDERIDIFAVLVYQQYKGFGILDTLREMDINGFNCGTSGSIMSAMQNNEKGTFKADNSVWLYYKGKYIHLRFMSFGSEDELKRIIQLMVRYNNPGSLTAKRGYLVNTMYDKSRVLALRPPASEYWAIFVRKFTLSDMSLTALIDQNGVKRADLPIQLIDYLMRGSITCAVTGRQGSGKTTLMAAIIRYIDARYTIRILEMAPELYLRELYPTRNILSLQETDYVTATELQDALKKSDGAVSIVGEVATDAIAARMIQMGMTASVFTIFSHHANTVKELVLTLRNSLVNAGGFSNMETAERQVTQVVRMDIHLDYSTTGERYIERISEVVPLAEYNPYPEYDPNDPIHSMNRIAMEYYNRRTDRISFESRDILRYDLKKRQYYVCERMTPMLESRLRSNLGELQLEFDKFMFAEWGKRTDLEPGEEDPIAKSLLEHYRETAEDELIFTKQVKGDLPASGVTVYDNEEDQQLTVLQDHLHQERIHQIEEEKQQEQQEENNSTVKLSKEDIDDAELFFDFFDGRF